MAFRERRSGVSFGFIFSSVSWLLVFFFRCADEEFHQSGGEVLALLLRIFCVRHIVERQVHLRRELLYRSLHLSPPWGLHAAKHYRNRWEEANSRTGRAAPRGLL